MMRYRLCLLLVMLACVPSPTIAAIVRVQSTITAGGGGEDSRGTPYGANVGAGRLLVAACAAYLDTFSTTAAAFTDTQANTWTVATHRGVHDPSSFVMRFYVAWTISGSASANTVTCNPPGTSAFISLVVIEYSGVATVSPVDEVVSTDSGGATTTTATTGTTGTTEQVSEVFVGVMTLRSSAIVSITQTAPLVLVQEEEDFGFTQGIAVGDRLLSSVGTYSGAWTMGTAVEYAASGITFKEAAVSAVRRRGGLVWFQ